MGNRAVITTENNLRNNGVGIYLHWNGGYDSVYPFLEYAKLRGFRSGDYGWARLCQVIGNFFGGNLSIGIDVVNHLDCDNGDNGVYLIDDNFNIVDRKYHKGNEQDEYDFKEMLLYIDEHQPEDDRIKEIILATPITEDTVLNVGDKVVLMDWDGATIKTTVYGFKDDVAYINYFGISKDPFDNPKNIISRDGKFRLLKEDN